MASKTYRCDFCGQCYKVKENFSKHTTRCEIFHRVLKNDEDENPNEEPPSNKELYKVIRLLLQNQVEMKKEISTLKQSIFSKNKVQVTKMLNEKKLAATDFSEFLRILPENITRTHLEKLMENDIMIGIKFIMEEMLKDNKVPIKAFTSKPNVVYVFKEGKWITSDMAEFIDMFDVFRRGFSKEFIRWSNDNAEKIEESEYLKEQEMNTMMKINGFNTSQDHKKAGELKQWLYEKCKTNICEFV
jgi:hypothetical protein